MHRGSIQADTYFWDEIQYYTDIIDAFHRWLTRDLTLIAGPDEADLQLWRWIEVHHQLLTALNYLGAEQALCGVYKAVVCFSHLETFFYANFSFSGEAAFKFFIENHPLKEGQKGWQHHELFPHLTICRQEIFADTEFIGIEVEPNPCDAEIKNITLIDEVGKFAKQELPVIGDYFWLITSHSVEGAANGVRAFSLILALVAIYIIMCLIAKAAFARFMEWKSKKEQFKLREDSLETNVADDHEEGLMNPLQRSENSDSQQPLFCNPRDNGTCKMRVIKVATV